MRARGRGGWASRLALGGALAAGALAIGAALLARREPAPARWAAVERKRFEVWLSYEGTIESREVRHIASQLGGAAVLVEVAPDGSYASAGDVLARFDTTEWEADLVRLERDWALAAREAFVLTNAVQPLEREDLALRLAQAERQYSNDLFLLEASRELQAENLISEQELAQQEERTRAAASDAAVWRRKLDLTESHLHPAAVEKARLTLAALEEQLAAARRRVSNGVIRAAAPGMVAHRPIGMAGEFRTVRPGDALYRNQPFLTLTDLSNLVLRCEAPESDLGRLRPGCAAVVTPLAYPDLQLAGRVEALGVLTAAARRGGKSFEITVALADGDARLRCGMSARARVLSYAADGALTALRAALWWEGGQAWCRVLNGSRGERRALQVGQANDAEVEVLSGLAAGERVALP